MGNWFGRARAPVPPPPAPTKAPTTPEPTKASPAPARPRPRPAARAPPARTSATPTPTAAPPPPPPKPLAFMSNSEGPSTMERWFRSEAFLTVVVASLARVGKSTLCNWLASVISGSSERGFASSADTAIDQFTQAMQARPMFDEFGHGTPLAACGKELHLVDTKGFTNSLELSLVLSGRQTSGEALTPGSYAEVATRPCDPQRMVHCVVLPIRATTVVDPTNANNAACLDKVRQIVLACNHFVPDEQRGLVGYQIQVIPVITCVDEVTYFSGKDVSCLGVESPEMTRLKAACTDCGIDTQHAVFLGWLHDEPANFDDLTDPRVKAVWTLLCRCVRFGTSTKVQARKAGWL